MNNKLIDTRLGNTPQFYITPREDIDMRVPDEILKCVVFIGIPEIQQSGQVNISLKGTGFFVSVPSETNSTLSYIYLITAKHVAINLEDKPFSIRVNTKNGNSVLVNGVGTKWFYHPNDKAVDVAAIPWAPPDPIEYKAFSISAFLSDDVIKNQNIGPGDEVFIVGLFTQLTGSKRNLPIVRIGNIAMIPEEMIQTKDFGNIEAYLIEARSIGGLSGSPAFVIESKIPPHSFYLLGLVRGHWDIPPKNKNDMILIDTDDFKSINMGIAIVIPAKKILEVINQPKLLKSRQEQEREMGKQMEPTLDKSEIK